MRPARPGVSLPETLLVAWLFGFVLWAVAGFAASQSRLLARLNDGVRAEDVVRTAGLILGADTRALARADFAAVTDDSIRLRAVRGGGPVCAAAGGTAFVRYRGIRRPNPEKDSVLVLSDERTVGRAYSLMDAWNTGRCGGSVALDLDSAAPGAGWVLVFETGAYHLTGRALRYRRGRGGRQALTETLLDDGSFATLPDGRLRLRLLLDPDSLPRLSGLVATAVLRAADPVRP